MKITHSYQAFQNLQFISEPYPYFCFSQLISPNFDLTSGWGLSSLKIPASLIISWPSCLSSQIVMKVWVEDQGWLMYAPWIFSKELACQISFPVLNIYGHL